MTSFSKTDPDEARAGERRPSLAVLFSVIVVDLIGFGIVVPILPFWAERFGADGTTLGLLLASHAGMQLVGAPIWGRLSDRIGRRPVMLITIAGTAVALLLLGFATSLYQLFLARLLSGLFAANISVATAYLTDVTDEEDRTRWMGMIGASFAVGFTLGPPLGGLLTRVGDSTPMTFAAGLAGLNFVWAWLRLREPAQRASARPGDYTSRFDVLRQPDIARLCLVYFLFTLAVTQLETTFAFYMSHRFGFDELGVAMVMLAMAIVMGGIQGGGMKRLAAKFQERRLVLSGLAGMTVAFAAVPLADSVAWLMLPLALAAIGRALAQPPMMSLVSLFADERSRGIVMGVFQSSASAARVVGPIAAGLLYDVDAAWPYHAAAGLTAFGFVLALAVRERGDAGEGVARDDDGGQGSGDGRA
ncbi:MAG: MFS transporter [Myxococcota bacterium]